MRFQDLRNEAGRLVEGEAQEDAAARLSKDVSALNPDANNYTSGVIGTAIPSILRRRVNYTSGRV